MNLGGRLYILKLKSACVVIIFFMKHEFKWLQGWYAPDLIS